MIRDLLAWRLRRGRARLDRRTSLALAVLAGWTIAAGLAPWSGYQPGFDADPSRAGLGPVMGHPLGTDHLGRDTFWRLLLGARAFLGPGSLAVALSLALGISAGASAGWYGGGVAAVLRGVATVVASVPALVFVLLVLAVWGNTPAGLAVAVAVAYAPALVEELYARIAALRAREYPLAAEAHGVPAWRVLWIHLVLGASGGLVARHALHVLAAVLVVETTLSYVGGFGVQEPTPSWGNMLVFEWGRPGSWVPRFAPAVAIWATVAATTTAARWVGGEVHD